MTRFKCPPCICVQIAASTVEYVTSEEIPAEVFEREKEIEMGREDLQSKPEAIRAKIAEGRVKKLVQVRHMSATSEQALRSASSFPPITLPR